MMAKMFYTLDETTSALNKSEDEVKQYTREGKLREFRDGPRLMFKADQVENLKAELGIGSGDQVDLGPSDTGSALSLSDSRSGTGSGSVLSLSDTGNKDDTAMDIGLSSSRTPARKGGSPGGSPGGSRSGSGSGMGISSGTGINVLGNDDSDPSAKTSVSQSSYADQASLEGLGSGSGLLDLSRENRDDTSLGGVLEEISPRGGDLSGSGVAVGGGGGATMASVAEPMRPNTVASARGGAIYVEAADPIGSGLGGAALAAAVFSVLGLLAISGAVTGTVPTLLSFAKDMSPMILAAIGAGAAVVFFVIGLVLGKK